MQPGSATTYKRSIEELLGPLRGNPVLKFEVPGSFQLNGREYFLPKFVYQDPSGVDKICLAVFAAIHGDEPAGAFAASEFLQTLVRNPEIAEGYAVHVYPICNPTGFEDGTRFSRSGRDLNREFWKTSTEPEVQILEQELKTGRFDGIVQLHADDTSEGIYGFVRGHTLAEHILRPALLNAGKILPRNINAQIDGFAARDGIIRDLYEGILCAPARIQPEPFEIIFETPGTAPIEQQIAAFVAALQTILLEYRRMISFAQNI